MHALSGKLGGGGLGLHAFELFTAAVQHASGALLARSLGGGRAISVDALESGSGSLLSQL